MDFKKQFKLHFFRPIIILIAAIIPQFVSSQTQSFVEGLDNLPAFIASGWTIDNASEPVGTSTWGQGQGGVFNSFDGGNNDYVYVSFNSTSGAGTISNWLISPELMLDKIYLLLLHKR